MTHADAIGGRRDLVLALVAASAASLETMPFLVAAGLVACGPMGADMSGIGIAAAFAGAIVVGLFTAGVAGGLIASPLMS